MEWLFAPSNGHMTITTPIFNAALQGAHALNIGFVVIVRPLLVLHEAITGL